MSTFRPHIDPSIKEEIARKRMSEVSEKYNLGLEEANLEFDSSLPYNVMGRTIGSGYRGDDITIQVGDSFINSSEPEQLKTMLHEGVHFKQFRNETDDWLRDNFNVSESFAREAERVDRSRDIDEIEGMTEAITDNLLPFEASTGYPYQKKRKEAELEAKGIDVESELMEDIQDEIDDIVENYKEVYSSFQIGDFYFEEGSFNGFDYSAVIVGSYSPEKAVNSYLEEFSDEAFDQDYSEMLESEYDDSRQTAV